MEEGHGGGAWRRGRRRGMDGQEITKAKIHLDEKIDVGNCEITRENQP